MQGCGLLQDQDLTFVPNGMGEHCRPTYLLKKICESGIMILHFLQHVARWYGQILPFIRNYEIGQGGTVIAVQLENELDFYPCSDPKGYISALRDMAVQHGISVPLIACAGQGGLLEASGFC